LSPVDIVVALVMLVAMLENRIVIIPAIAMGLVLLRGSWLRLVKGYGFKRVEWAVVAFLVYWLLNYSWSTADLHNLYSFEFLRRDGALLVTYPVFLALLGWALKPRYVRAYWIVFLTALALIAVAGIMVSLNLPHPLFFYDLDLVGYNYGVGNMFFGWYEAHNTAGSVYMIAATFALALLQERSTWKVKLFCWFLFLACTGGLLFTFSRGAYFGFVAAVLLILPIRKLGRMMKVALLLVLPTVALGMMSSEVLERIDSISDPHQVTTAYRFKLWSDAWEMFVWSPLVGIGFGRFNDLAVHFQGIKYFVWVGTQGQIENSDVHAHNSYMHFLAEGGIIGLGLALFIWWCVWKELSLWAKRLQGTNLYTLCTASKACTVGVLVAAITEHMLGRGTVILTLMTLLGMTLASARAEWARMQEEEVEKTAIERRRQMQTAVHRIPVAAAR
jgi:O-antigen ligase